MGYSGAPGTLIHEKNLKLKISCQTPFKWRQIYLVVETLTYRLCGSKSIPVPLHQTTNKVTKSETTIACPEAFLYGFFDYKAMVSFLLVSYSTWVVWFGLVWFGFGYLEIFAEWDRVRAGTCPVCPPTTRTEQGMFCNISPVYQNCLSRDEIKIPFYISRIGKNSPI
jgi:hypothetical protein